MQLSVSHYVSKNNDTMTIINFMTLDLIEIFETHFFFKCQLFFLLFL